jgi:hypothetical protein
LPLFAPFQFALLKSHSGATAVLLDEFDAGGLQRGTDLLNGFVSAPK